MRNSGAGLGTLTTNVSMSDDYHEAARKIVFFVFF